MTRPWQASAESGTLTNRGSVTVLVNHDIGTQRAEFQTQ